MYSTKQTKMKLYKLEIYLNTRTEQVEVEAEAHTFDNGMIIFWTRNPAQEWAMVAAYPATMTAIVYYDEIGKPQLTGQVIAQAPSLSELTEIVGKTVKEPVKKRSKK